MHPRKFKKKIFINPMRRRQVLSNKTRRRPDFLTESWLVWPFRTDSLYVLILFFYSRTYILYSVHSVFYILYSPFLSIDQFKSIFLRFFAILCDFSAKIKLVTLGWEEEEEEEEENTPAKDWRGLGRSTSFIWRRASAACVRKFSRS